MQKWSRAAVTAVALVLVGAGAGAAVASASPAAHTQRQPANLSRQVARPAALVDTTVESKYTPIAPCRIVDTRVAGGAIAANGSRSFRALGSGSFAAQGGTSCDIPFSATAVTGSVISADATGAGYLKVFGWGKPEPTASFLNYVKSPVLSASGTIPVSDSTYDFTVKVATHATQIVIQLTGYYIAPMWVEVSSTAEYLRGSRVTALSGIGTGLYEVDFDRNIVGCAYTANSYSAGITIEVEPRVTNADGVFVVAEDSTGTLLATTFYLTVTC